MKTKYWLCNDYGRQHGHFQEVSMLDILRYLPETTKSDICNYLELKNFDYALPQAWVDDVEKVTGIYPASFFVWDYSEDSFGRPLPIRREGETILRIYNILKKEEQHG